MNTTLLAFVIAYLLATMALGMYAGTRIKTTADFAVAGRSLPLAMVITTTFATWFGAETVMGIPAKFVQGGLGAMGRQGLAIRSAIRAPWGQEPALRQAVKELRGQGHTVVCVLPGHEHDVQEFDCDRELALIDGRWSVRSL